MTRQPVPGLHENFAGAAAMSTDKPLGYIREPGLRSLAEGNHTTMYPKQIPAHGYTIPVFAHPPAKREAGETWATGDKVIYESDFGPVSGTVLEAVEGWWNLRFRDGSTSIVRPSRIRAALEASHE